MQGEIESFNRSNQSDLECFEDLIRGEFRVLIKEQFWLSVVIGSTIVLLGLVANCFLIFILKPKEIRKTSCLYLLAISIIDVGMELNYLFLITISLTSEYFEWPKLHHLWGSYAAYLFTLGQVAPVAQTGMIIAASFDRLYLSVRSFQAKRLPQNSSNSNPMEVAPTEKSEFPSYRLMVIIGFVVWSILFKGMTYWEVETIYSPECSGFAYVTLYPSTSELFNSEEFKFFKFWIIPVFQVYLPFITLMTVNILIVTLLRHEMRLAQRRTSIVGVVEKEFRGATYSLTIIISAYLISNIVNVVVAFCEQLYSPAYLMQEYRTIYTLSSDLSSILVMTTCASRLPTYYACNSRLRAEMLKKLQRFRKHQPTDAGQV